MSVIVSHNGKTPYQESGRMRGSVGSCRLPSSRLMARWVCMASLIHLVKRSGSLSYHRRLRPVDDMVLLSCMVGESGFVMFC